MRVDSLFGSRLVNPSEDLDEAMLTKMAQATGGRYFRARNSEELADIYREIDKLEPAADAKQTLRPIDELYWMPLAASLLAAACAFGVPLVRISLGRARTRERVPRRFPFPAAVGAARARRFAAALAGRATLRQRCGRLARRGRCASAAASHRAQRRQGIAHAARARGARLVHRLPRAAGPAWEREPQPLLRNEAARVFALELAPTMLAQDVKPSRLDRARFKLDDLLARSRDYQTALIGYAGEAFVAAPLTDDVGTVRHLVESLDPSTMPVAGNATGRAIDKSVALIEQAGLHQGQIVLIADAADGGALAAAKRAHAKGFDVSVLGVGTPGGAPVALAQGDFLKDSSGNVVLARLDETALRELASAGGGRYATLAADRSDVDALLPDDARVGAAKSVDAGDDALGNRWRDRGPWLLLALVPIALLGFRRGWLMLVALALYAHAAHACREPISGNAAISRRQPRSRGDAKDAATVAPDAVWRGAAAYRDGDYAKAVDEYAHADSADGAYNRGNALAQLGRYEEAIAAYDDALKHAPDMPDAVANRKIVEDALKRQQQQQQNQQGQNDQQKNGDDKKQGDPQQKSGEGDSQKKDQDSKQQNGDESKQGDSKDGKDSQQQGKDSQSQDGKSQDAQKNDASASDNQKQPSQDGDSKSQQQGDDQQSASPSPQDAQQAQADAKQREALSQSVDQALAKDGKQGDKDGERKSQVAVPAEDAATREKRQALDQWLQRVPDDPGGLLRRKFMLEYQRRQQGGGDGR
jgi:Ca-activated chloride channel family protein